MSREVGHRASFAKMFYIDEEGRFIPCLDLYHYERAAEK